ncbi:alkaline phosphatase family protein [Bradyrhizobium sp. U87765 SZCCT0131]|uniref:alkaline phosphatase family protein n=1 Tax=unclassified Bradyrhizobium TaxID=2631580 RepID=UPI001BACF8CC|nr:MULTISPECIES: alkaline phosphatase family protein [unclassified Bradyrhizobium]MBR1223182.1 alkaline phosphatase family protein [Bradyrhizobium sp. U87765 SZCCT0131]MBR1265760.1 alkaline phosphatase family protein [Bradyrhizobium sp. U87765 SZCCT0134]MBR1309269.1 alkaline phosphatase family protein [Bradyrhizobium sp. U87765 SZCCT0110]MBR1323152.1 alkaline phosphatase family protein [Bradyrhizobium sp. U87765 SZCCT0109]MBR1350933.1 alkaline phosphatase family protein [Bradyrhizobium sp. U87
MRPLITALSAGLLAVSTHAALAQTSQPRNIILFVPDGLRALKVTPETAPTMAAIRDKGINFTNSHSLFPTFTMPNASGLSSGHYLGDTGIFSNTINTGYPVGPANGSVTPFIENDPVLGDIDDHFGGNYLNEETILKLARDKGYSTAAVGKLGPTLMFDHNERTGKTIILDDQTGSPAGVPLTDDIKKALTDAGLPTSAPSRGDNGKAGDFKTAGTTTANVTQGKFFADAVTKVILPAFKARNKPFIIVLWSRDPDGSQHNQGDSLNSVTPGINGPTSLAAIKNADDNLGQVRQALKDLGLEANTNIIVSADHGFSTISKESATSPAAKGNYPDVKEGFLPPGFVALDLAKALDLPLADPDSKNAVVAANSYPRLGNGLIGKDAAKPDVVVAANGGSDLIYLPKSDRKLARRVVDALLAQDYVSGIFVNDELAPIHGTLRLSAIGLKGNALTPHPSIVVNFRSYSTGCDQPVLCTVEIADTRLQQGQGMHGNFARSDTQNFMAAIGPDFKTGYVNALPVSNADVGMTIARILDLKSAPKGKLVGRVMTETMPNGSTPKAYAGTLTSPASSNGLRTVLKFQRVQEQRYFDVAGFPGRTVGLEADKSAGR